MGPKKKGKEGVSSPKKETKPTAEDVKAKVAEEPRAEEDSKSKSKKERLHYPQRSLRKTRRFLRKKIQTRRRIRNLRLLQKLI